MERGRFKWQYFPCPMLGMDEDVAATSSDGFLEDPDVMARLRVVLGDEADAWLAASDDLLSPEEVAIKMRVSVHVVRRLLRNKELTGIKMSGRWQVPQSSVTSYVASRLT